MQTETTFTCRCCGRYAEGFFDGRTVEAGWRYLERLDGPDHICPDCVKQGDNALEHLRQDYENVFIGKLCQ
jgi:hypothetical protein